MVSHVIVNDIINLFGISKPPESLRKCHVVLTLTQNNRDRLFLLFKLSEEQNSRDLLTCPALHPDKPGQILALGTIAGGDKAPF